MVILSLCKKLLNLYMLPIKKENANDKNDGDSIYNNSKKNKSKDKLKNIKIYSVEPTINLL